VCPCISTTRVEATFSASRSIVAISSTDGKIAKSSGLRIENTEMTISSDSAMLKVNSTSSASGGSGTTIIASIASRATGTPTPRSSCRRNSGALNDAGVEAAMDQVPAPRWRPSDSTAGSMAGGAGSCSPALRAVRNAIT
jgi:hypothetical protein